MQFQHSIDSLGHSDRVHAAKVNRAFAQKTGAALYMPSQDDVLVAEWPGRTWLRRPEHCHRRDTDQPGEVHCASIVGEQKTAGAQFLD